MSGMMRHQTPQEGAGVTEVVQELSRRGRRGLPVSSGPSGADLNIVLPETNRSLLARVTGNPRFDRRGQPEWLVGSWKFQPRPRTEMGLPFFRHPFYPGFWVLWDFPTHCAVNIFVWPPEGQDDSPRFFIASIAVLRQLLSEAPPWAENYHGVRDRPHWVGPDVIGPFEAQWRLVEEMGA